MRRILTSSLFCLCLFLVFLPILNLQAQDATQSNGKGAVRPAATKPSNSEIAAAKAAGKVWVNLDSGVYHKTGRWYGKTKNGQFMTVADAKKAGYRATKRN